MDSSRLITSTFICLAAGRCRGRRDEWVLRLLLLLVTVAWVQTSAAQTSPYVGVETGLQRDVNQYRWRFGVDTAGRQGAWSYDVRNLYLSDAFILFNDELRFRDENELTWRVGRPLGGHWSTLAYGRLSYFGQSRVLIQQSLAGVEFRPDERLMIRPMVGLALDQRPGGLVEGGRTPLRSDVGPAVALAASYIPTVPEPYTMQLEGSGQWYSIHPRRGYTIHADVSAGGRFEETDLNSRLGYGASRRDVYQAVSFLNRGLPTDQLSESIEATSSDTLALRLGMTSSMTNRLSLTGQLNGAVIRRFIRTHNAPDESLFFDTNFSRRAFDIGLGLRYQDASRTGSIDLEYGANAEERRLVNVEDQTGSQIAQMSLVLQQANFEQSTMLVRAQLQQDLRRRGYLSAETIVSITRRDTPDNNPDDRDEAYANARGTFAYRWSRYLSTDISVFASRYHTVFLNARRSAENNVQRSLRLRPVIRWTPTPATHVAFRPEIRATYTVDDFAIEGRRPTDQSAREMRFDVEAEHNFGRGLRVIAQGGTSELHLGRLFWNSFAEIPFDTLSTYNGWLRVRAGERVVAEVGARTFIRTDYNRALTIRYTPSSAEGDNVTATVTRSGRAWVRQIGPTAAINTSLGRSYVSLEGWLTFQRIHYRLYGDLPENEAVNIRRTARRGRLLTIPNMSLTVRWRL